MRTPILAHRAIPRPLISLRTIGLPEKRLEILERIRTALRGWLDMVDLPAVIGSGVAVVGILHRVAANVASPNRFVVSFNRRSSLPYGQLGLLIGCLERVCVRHGVCGGEFILENSIY